MASQLTRQQELSSAKERLRLLAAHVDLIWRRDRQVASLALGRLKRPANLAFVAAGLATWLLVRGAARGGRRT